MSNYQEDVASSDELAYDGDDGQLGPLATAGEALVAEGWNLSGVQFAPTIITGHGCWRTLQPVTAPQSIDSGHPRKSPDSTSSKFPNGISDCFGESDRVVCEPGSPERGFGRAMAVKNSWFRSCP